MTDKTKQPVALDDAALDKASGALPAVQKVREVPPPTTAGSAHPGGANFVFADGSVR